MNKIVATVGVGLITVLLTALAYAQPIRIFLDTDCENVTMRSRIEDAYRANLGKLPDVVFTDKDSCDLALIAVSNHPFIGGGMAIAVLIVDTDNRLLYRDLITCDVINVREAIALSLPGIRETLRKWRK
jgi:hypothetical protein